MRHTALSLLTCYAIIPFHSKHLNTQTGKRNLQEHLPSSPSLAGSPLYPRGPGGPGSPFLPAGICRVGPAWPFGPEVHQHS